MNAERYQRRAERWAVQWGAVLLLTVMTVGCEPARPAFPKPTFARAIQWADRGVWLKADTHIHSQFSDGGLSLEELVRRGKANGCNVLAITDHADSNLTATSEEYFLQLEAARKAHPELVLLSGLEWNVPPWQGREHAVVLVPPGVHERKLLREFQVLFDDFQREHRDPLLATSALHWLKEHSYGIGGLPVVFYNHPCRKRDSSSQFAAEFARYQRNFEVAVGFEGGPGHQESQPIGNYQDSLPTIDRWDPAVATIDGAWDELLRQGAPVWGALATSDFHTADPQKPDDYLPGEFSETWLFAPSATAQGALDALRSGSFFGVHGRIARNVKLQVLTSDLPRPALAGEAIRMAPGGNIEIKLEMSVPAEDWKLQPNLIDEVEFIAVSNTGARSVHRHHPASGSTTAQTTLPVPSGGLTVRARGRRVVVDGPDLMFYTNPIQILTYGMAPSELAPSGVIVANALPPFGSDTSFDGRPRIPAFVLLAFVACGGMLVALIDRWRIEAARRFAGQKANSPRPHTKPHASIRWPLMTLFVLIALAAISALRPFQFTALNIRQAMSRWWLLLQQPFYFDLGLDKALQSLLFFLIGFLATWILLGQQASDRRRLAALPLVVAGCLVLSAALQLAQLWALNSAMSQNDMVIQSLSALLGGSAWLLFSPLAVRKRHKRQVAATVS